MKKFALVVIDMQGAYFRNGELADRKVNLVDSANELITAAIGSSVPVFTVRTEHARDRSTWTLNMLDDGEGYLFSGDDETKVIPELKTEDTIEIIKTRDSAFFGTNLEDQLHDAQIDTIVLLGVSTHSCVLHTAADAYAHNFRVYLAQDAIASHDMKFHQPTLDQLAQEYRQKICSNKELLNLLAT